MAAHETVFTRGLGGEFYSINSKDLPIEDLNYMVLAGFEAKSSVLIQELNF